MRAPHEAAPCRAVMLPPVAVTRVMTLSAPRRDAYAAFRQPPFIRLPAPLPAVAARSPVDVDFLMSPDCLRLPPPPAAAAAPPLPPAASCRPRSRAHASPSCRLPRYATRRFFAAYAAADAAARWLRCPDRRHADISPSAAAAARRLLCADSLPEPPFAARRQIDAPAMRHAAFVAAPAPHAGALSFDARDTSTERCARCAPTPRLQARPAPYD